MIPCLGASTGMETRPTRRADDEGKRRSEIRRSNPEGYRCTKHPDLTLVCPLCDPALLDPSDLAAALGGRGGKLTARKHKGKHKLWGKKGGRPKKPKRKA